MDVCVDFVTDYPLHLIRDENWITRAKTINRYTVHRQFSGFSIGGGGALSARLYNKTLEIESSDKTFFHEVWKRYGWKPGETVWRLEFQFRRAVLKELGVFAFTDLLEKLGGLWGYATRAWLRLADPATTTQKRSDTRPSNMADSPLNSLSSRDRHRGTVSSFSFGRLLKQILQPYQKLLLHETRRAKKVNLVEIPDDRRKQDCKVLRVLSPEVKIELVFR